MATIGFYFAGLRQDEANAVRAKLNAIAAEFGFVARSGPTKGQGNAADLLVALARGDLYVAGFPVPEVGTCKSCGGEGRTLTAAGVCLSCEQQNAQAFADKYLTEA